MCGYCCKCVPLNFVFLQNCEVCKQYKIHEWLYLKNKVNIRCYWKFCSYLFIQYILVTIYRYIYLHSKSWFKNTLKTCSTLINTSKKSLLRFLKSFLVFHNLFQRNKRNLDHLVLTAIRKFGNGIALINEKMKRFMVIV